MMTSSLLFPPGLMMIAGAFILFALRGKARASVALALPLFTLAYVWYVISTQNTLVFDSLALYIGGNVTPVAVSGSTQIFATVFCFITFAGTLFALRQENRSEIPAAMVHAGAAICVTFAGDLLTMFVFWEIMTLGSTVIIWSASTKKSFRAGMRYFGLHAIGGVVLLSGISLYIAQLKGLAAPVADPFSFTLFADNLALLSGMDHLGWDNLGAWMILAGMLLNAGAPPFSAWVADAYPEASPSGTVFLSTFTTKTAVFTLLVAFPGTSILVPIGIYMAFYGVFYAVTENNIRRILAYHIVSQVGFMVCGVGIGTPMALNGAAALAVTHVLYKTLLMMSAGAVLQQTGRQKLSELGGLYQTMPVTFCCFIVGGLAISAFPFLAGFISKSMIVSAVGEGPHTVAWFLLVAAGVGTCLSIGIKLPWFVFFHRSTELRPVEAPGNMKAAMASLAVLCILLGIFYEPAYSLLPYAEVIDYEPYTIAHIVGNTKTLLFTALAFFLLLPLMKQVNTIHLDWDWLWRRLMPRAWDRALLPLISAVYRVGHSVVGRVPALVFGDLGESDSHRRLPRAWTLSHTALMTMAILLLYLLASFWRSR